MKRVVYWKSLFVGIILMSVFVCPVFGQLDSMLEITIRQPDNEEKITALMVLASNYSYEYPDSCFLIADKMKSIARKIDYELGEIYYLYLQNRLNYIIGDYENAIESGKEGLRWINDHKHINDGTVTKINGLIQNIVGMSLAEINRYDEATEAYLKAIDIFKKEDPSGNIANVYNNLGDLFQNLDNLVEAEKYFLLARDIYFAHKDTFSYSMVYANLGAVQALETEALDYYKKALEFVQYGPVDVEILIYFNYGGSYEALKQYDEAIHWMKKSLQLAQEYDFISYYPRIYSNLSVAYSNKNRADSAIFFAQKGIETIDYSYDYQFLELSYETLRDEYKKKGNYQQSLEYSELLYGLRDSIYQDDIAWQIKENVDKYEFEKKQRTIVEQQLQISEAANIRNIIILIALLGLALIAGGYQWYLYRQRKKVQANELALAQQQAEASRLRELDELKTNFFTNISHELRTPLTLILSPLADLQEQVRAVPVREKLSIIKSNAQRLLNLVNEIMDLAKVEAGKLDLQESKVELQQMIQRIFYSYESLAALRRIDFNLDYELEEKQVLIDRGKLEKILHNLLSNAIKYTGAGGQVSMKVSQQGGHHFFEVRDTGQGVDTQDLSRIFDRFYQAKQGTLQGGTGVGLALSKELAELMQGTLSVQSDLGQGSVFTLSLPLEVVGVLKSEVENQEEGLFIESDNQNPIPETLHLTPTIFAPIAIEGEKARLLVVEDNPEMGKYLVQILSENYHCVLATDGQEALKQLKLSRFDCITSDVMMPNMDGFELREVINQNDKWRQIPFLLLTARQLEEDRIRGFQMGIDDYVTKPFSTRELQARIHNLITNKLERDAYTASEQSVPKEEQLSVDQQFLKQVEQAVLERISDPQFGVEDLAKAVNYSSKQLGRLLKKHTGMSTVSFILEVRLQKAREVLERRLSATVLEAQLDVGISSTPYFTRKFTERFGKNPSELL
ncbi:MAG: ATP-binding protein [Chitinophagales bacterium]|nr:ATP-binding protein [Chitinophagales bacterium]